jgi:catechol 2,3-dioxygenase-like lactoylglutathione lyase family enzyme
MYKIPDNMRIGPPVLRVRNIGMVIAFYENSLGLQAIRRYKVNPSDHDDNSNQIVA